MLVESALLEAEHRSLNCLCQEHLQNFLKLKQKAQEDKDKKEAWAFVAFACLHSCLCRFFLYPRCCYICFELILTPDTARVIQFATCYLFSTCCPCLHKSGVSSMWNQLSGPFL